MAQGKLSHEWNYFASLQALIANCNRNPKKQPAPFTPAQFHPFLARQRRQNAGVGEYLTAKREMARRRRLRLVG